jgi:hypothetical protein
LHANTAADKENDLVKFFDECACLKDCGPCGENGRDIWIPRQIFGDVRVRGLSEQIAKLDGEVFAHSVVETVGTEGNDQSLVNLVLLAIENWHITLQMGWEKSIRN